MKNVGGLNSLEGQALKLFFEMLALPFPCNGMWVDIGNLPRIFQCIIVFMLVFLSPISIYYFFIPLQAKQIGEIIEIRHRKILPTRILSTLGCLSLCHSVTL